MNNTMTNNHTQTRNTVRALVFNDEEQILLMQLHSKSPWRQCDEQIFWITLGGEIEAGETYTETLFRELQEEAGIADVISFTPIGASDQVVPWKGVPTRITEQFFAVRVAEGAVNLDQINFTEEEKQLVVKHQWWNIDDLARSGEIFFPENLVDLVRGYLGKE